MLFEKKTLECTNLDKRFETFQVMTAFNLQTKSTVLCHSYIWTI